MARTVLNALSNRIFQFIQVITGGVTKHCTTLRTHCRHRTEIHAWV